MKKKAVSILLSITMCLSLTAGTAYVFAESEETDTAAAESVTDADIAGTGDDASDTAGTDASDTISDSEADKASDTAGTDATAEEGEKKESHDTSLLDILFDEDGLLSSLADSELADILSEAADELKDSDPEISQEMKDIIRAVSSKDVRLAKKLRALAKISAERGSKTKKALGSLLSEFLKEDGSIDMEKSKILLESLLGENGSRGVEKITESTEELGGLTLRLISGLLGAAVDIIGTEEQALEEDTSEESADEEALAELMEELLGEEAADAFFADTETGIDYNGEDELGAVNAEEIYGAEMGAEGEADNPVPEDTSPGDNMVPVG